MKAAGRDEENIQKKGLIPEGQKDRSLEMIPKKFNWPKITPDKMILLDVKPGAYPLQKIWEPGSATIRNYAG